MLRKLYLNRNYKYLLLILCIFILVGCSFHSLQNRVDLANNLALKNMLVKKDISTDNFIFRTYGKFYDKNKSLRIYIEGDGFAWIDKRTISSNPTPVNPIALKLASKDTFSNIIYIARPCQYNLELNKNCKSEYWTNKRFSIEVINSFNYLIDILKLEYGFKNIELIGFSGGAAIATLVASKRNDISKITTIAGNLNHDLVNKIHNVSKMKESLNPIDIANKISYIPQIHYVGEKDRVIPIEVAKSFKEVAINSENIKIILFQNATHTTGWENINLE